MPYNGYFCNMLLTNINKVQFLLLLILLACHPEDNQNSVKFKQELENRKLQRITQGQLIAFASRIGKTILDSNDKFSNPLFLQKIDSSYGIRLFNYSIPNQKIKGKLSEITEAYLYNQEHNIISEDNLQKEGDTLLYYTRPILSNNSITGIKVLEMNKKKLIKKYTDNRIIFAF